MARSILQLIENLVSYAKRELGLMPLDAIYARNRLFALLKTAPSEQVFELAEVMPLQAMLDEITAYAVEAGLCAGDRVSPLRGADGAEGCVDAGSKLRFETEVMGLVTPCPSLVELKFKSKLKVLGIVDACNYLYDMGVKSNYIRLCDVNKNVVRRANLPDGDIVITINLSKPEKDNKQVALEAKAPKTKYPACLLCPENLGFSGTVTHPARETLRMVPITVGGEDWYMQYSPYVYYEQHCIALSARHNPMAVTPATFTKLLDFCKQFPHYFIGSNADLPIVGGSILSHDHYQGGAKVLPMLSRPARRTFVAKRHKSVAVSVLDWYNSVIRLSSKNREELEMCARAVLSAWRGYSDSSVGVLAQTDAPHNTITPIAHADGDIWNLDLILRNNRTDEAHPYGIFHPTEDLHGIKKEGIGLIEAMGTFILPGRLKAELETVEGAIAGKAPTESVAKYHQAMLDEMKKTKEPINSYIDRACVRILECTAVFKKDEAGQTAFDRFINSVGL